MSARSLTAAAAKQRLHAGREIAFLDVREPAAFGEGHPLFAVPCPYSRLEVLTIALVPRADAAVLLIDDGDGVAARAAERLAACGYTDVSLIEGGMPAWAAAGYGVFAGVNVPSKTLGEMLEHTHHPRTIDAATLRQWQREGREHLFFDARPPAEFAKMRIEGARCLPNGELAHRFAAVVPDEAVPVVITCAGRTRGIIGALGLRAAGIRNPVLALENGTQGWALAGFPLDRGADPNKLPDELPLLDPQARQASRARAETLIARNELARISATDAAAMLDDRKQTSYLFDLRSAHERSERPCRAAVPVLAGQLVQATDQYVGVRHARLILVDDTGLRAALTALFLRALGFEPHILVLDDEPQAALPQNRTTTLRHPEAPPAMTAGEALRHVEAGAALLDLRPSQAWEARRLEGAHWISRADLPATLPAGTRAVVLHAEEADAVAAATIDLAQDGIAVHWLAASLDACAEAGWVIESEPRTLTREQASDRVWFVHDRHDGNREASLQYLAWEMGLIAQLDADERAAFGAVDLANA
ncbi:rhodanese [Starkeya sp. ORNL1]|uniref:rhodanese-like domain-containing protein n=1 Tax=Starkeya sp. ORNL1 TaxID=2709380 RepID=UPI001462AA88|nr:rhodanese-like domain-containing protein [Starkeya sp. ORNL1]QJP15614.1 rhodanese [Starkeya sp. ORNL1]